MGLVWMLDRQLSMEGKVLTHQVRAYYLCDTTTMSQLPFKHDSQTSAKRAVGVRQRDDW